MFKSAEGYQIQIGLLTYTPIICRSGPSGFTRIRPYLDWIRLEISSVNR